MADCAFPYLRCWWLVGLALAASLLAVPAVPAMAQERAAFPAGSVCSVFGSSALDPAELVKTPARWDCANPLPEWRDEREIIRHDLRGLAAAPRFIEFHRHPFDRLEILLQQADGSQQRQAYIYQDLHVSSTGRVGFLDLPAATGPVAAMIITLDGSNYPEALIAADITAEPPTRLIAGTAQLWAALICGLLLAPMLFDLGFLRALREPFPLFHAMFCIAASVQTASISGLIPLVTDIPPGAEELIDIISFNVMLTSLLLFLRSFLEPDALRGWHRKLLLGTACLPVTPIVLSTFGLELFPDAVLFGTMVAVYAAIIAITIFTGFVAWRRGSRAIRFVALAFLPFYAIGTTTVIGALAPSLALSFDRMWAQNFALLFEVCVTAFGVASRFLALKRERDNAVNEARSLENLSERDAMTGLLNRRALEDRFDALRAQGFTALAVVDLDHFKLVNDTYGHHVGDDVLIRAAHVLAGNDDDDLLAFRIGGEEFLLLLRGRAKQARAEERRRAIAEIIAGETAVTQPVTASMGYLDAAPGAVAEPTFDKLYERADRLLYEAKAHGRDRMVAEKVSVFQRRLSERREDPRTA